MTDKEKIRQEIERRIKEGYDAYAGNLKSILSFIDSLPKFNIGDTIRDPEDSEFTFHINKIEDGKYIEKDDAWVMIGEADENYELVEKQWKPVPKREPAGVLKELLDNIDEKELEETRKEMMEEAEREELKSNDLEGAKEQAWFNYEYRDSNGRLYRNCFEDGFELGANWQEQQFERNRLDACDNQSPEEAEREQNFVSKHIKENSRIPTYSDAIEYGIQLQKQQDYIPVSKDLEEEINRFVDIPENQGNPDLKEELSKCAHHFAQWQEQQDEKDTSDMLLVTYLRGGDEGKKIMVDKACKWLKQFDAYRLCLEGHKDYFIEQFRKAMAEKI